MEEGEAEAGVGDGWEGTSSSSSWMRLRERRMERVGEAVGVEEAGVVAVVYLNLASVPLNVEGRGPRSSSLSRAVLVSPCSSSLTSSSVTSDVLERNRAISKI